MKSKLYFYINYIKNRIKKLEAKRQKYLFKKNDYFRYLLLERGFFSEINNLIFGIYFCEKNNKKIIIDNSYFTYEWENNSQCIFNSKYIFIKKLNKNKLRKEKRKFYRSAVWQYIRNSEFREELVLEETKRKLQEILKNLYILKSFPEIEEGLKELPEKYVGLHIRRGDKVKGESKEADEVAIDEYIKLIPSEYNTFPLFIATDDKVVLEEIKKNYPTKTVYSFFCEKNIRKNEKEFNSLEKNRVKEHTLEFLKEVEALTNSSYFIGSYSSNVGRFIALRRGFKKCNSVDYSWEEIH